MFFASHGGYINRSGFSRTAEPVTFFPECLVAVAIEVKPFVNAGALLFTKSDSFITGKDACEIQHIMVLDQF